MKTFFALPVMVWLAVFSAHGQDVPPAFEKKENNEEVDPFDPLVGAIRVIRVQVEHIEVSHKDLTRLMMEDEAVTANAKALRMKVQELVEKGEAKVIDTQVLTGRSGRKATTQSVHEFIYPTEYEPPGHDPKAMEEAGFSPVHSFPTAFETKNLGSSLDADFIMGDDDKTIDVRIDTELVWHTGDTVWYQVSDLTVGLGKLAMPDFYVVSTNTSITCISGQYVLVGALSPKNAEGKLDAERKVMVFVKCDALPVVP